LNTKRIFFALWPDHRQRDRLRDFISPVAKLVEGRAVERSEWHVTLAYIGDLDVRFIPELMQSAKGIEFEPFRLRLDRLEFWPRPKIAAVVPPRVPPDMEALVDRLNGLVLASGVEPAQRVYRPHITVARAARPFEPLKLAQSAEIEWSRFELMESITEHGRTFYRPIVNKF
jgi:2'-5' RNA ligase